MSYTISELENLSDEELLAQHDIRAENTVMGISYFLDEIRSRKQAKTNKIMERITKRIYVLTIVVTLATLVNLALFAFQIMSLTA